MISYSNQYQLGPLLLVIAFIMYRISMEQAIPHSVADYRMRKIDKLDTVTFYPGSRMERESILEPEAEHVAIATGSI